MTKHIISVSLRILFIAICLCFFLTGRPPARAQVGPSVKDAVQDQQIVQLEERVLRHENTDDARVQQLSQDFHKLSAEVSEMRGEQRGWLGALAALQVIAGLFQVVQFRRSSSGGGRESIVGREKR